MQMFYIKEDAILINKNANDTGCNSQSRVKNIVKADDNLRQNKLSKHAHVHAYIYCIHIYTFIYICLPI